VDGCVADNTLPVGEFGMKGQLFFLVHTVKQFWSRFFSIKAYFAPAVGTSAAYIVAKITKPRIGVDLIGKIMAGVLGKASGAVSSGFGEKNTDAVPIHPPDLVGGAHAPDHGSGQPPDNLTREQASVTAVTSQVNVNEGKGKGIPVAAGTLVQDQCAELIARQQEFTS